MPNLGQKEEKKAHFPHYPNERVKDRALTLLSSTVKVGVVAVSDWRITK
jgi:hypothetical protein